MLGLSHEPSLSSIPPSYVCQLKTSMMAFALNCLSHQVSFLPRGILQQYCHRPCSIFDLENYCD
uniref:Insulin-like domain-containing protein n=1 Tax=Dicentrarchus labrax TaxID=13489 RepID=A0A8P4GM54_DICLA